MSVLSKKFLILLSIAAIGMVGCTKKPQRPDPTSTMLGPGSGMGGNGYGDGLNPTDINTGLDPLFDDSISGLEERGFMDGNLLREYFEPVYFDLNQSAIKPNERLKLEAVLIHLAENPADRILLEGHCDWRGTAEYNLGLGDRRASAASEFLRTAGAAADRIETLSKGDLEAIENADANTMAADRRVDIVIIKP